MTVGEYDNGSAKSAGRTEYIWLPTDSGMPIPIGLYRGGQFYALHTDYLGTPRLMTNEANKPVWQWPYSPFGSNKPTGVLKATVNPRVAITNKPVLLTATGAPEMNLGFPGQMRDVETGAFYNTWRDAYDANLGSFRQLDPIGLGGGLNRRGYAEGNTFSFIDPEGLKIIILLKPNDPNYKAATRVPDDPNTCIVISHGSPKSVNGMNAKELNAFLTAQGCKKMPVTLDACRTGQGEDSIAEQLARLRQTRVVAPDAQTWTTPWGMNFDTPYPPMSDDKSSPWNNVPNLSKPGTWREFRP